MTFTKEEIVLQAKNIHLAYDGKQILRGVCFEIKNIVRPGLQQGQVISLVGRSGIGKTQLFKLLAGLQQPTSGEILIHGDEKVKAGDMGIIFQNYYLFEWRTVYASLMLAARKNPALAGKEKDAIAQYAGNFHLAAHLHKYPQQLSGGQRQRVSIIQQLLKGSDFLLLDEPFSGLDVLMLDKVVELLLKVSLSDDLKTLIIVSHDIATSVAISDTVFILAEQEGQAGATIVKEIDLIDRGLAWDVDIEMRKEFAETIEEIKACL
jgi:polar amino acid transport system ATP-binding protein/sulfate transport system ATP-binding protein/NitT/TauT family transport system ATP-binding protein